MATAPTIERFEVALDGWKERLRYYERFERVGALIDERFPELVSRDEAAAAATLSRSAFSNRFSEKIGISFRHFQLATRVGVALKLLRERNYSMRAVARLAGFRSLRSMERAFQRFLGMSPSEMRRSWLQPTEPEGNPGAGE